MRICFKIGCSFTSLHYMRYHCDHVTQSVFFYKQQFHILFIAIEDTNQKATKGSLSSRMLIPGNTWQVVWKAAKPVPARRQVRIKAFLFTFFFSNSNRFHIQKRLFDDTKEAEKVMHFFESRNIGQIVQLTLAALYHTALLQIKVRYFFSNTHIRRETELYISQDQITTEHSIIPNFNENFEKLKTLCCKLSRESWSSNGSTTSTSRSTFHIQIRFIRFR